MIAYNTRWFSYRKKTYFFSDEKAYPSVYQNKDLNYHNELKNNQFYNEANIKKDATVLDERNGPSGKLLVRKLNEELANLKREHNHYMLIRSNSKFITEPSHRTQNFKNRKNPIICNKISQEKFSNYEHSINKKRICPEFHKAASNLKALNKRIASTNNDIKTQNYTSTERNYTTTTENRDFYQHLFNWREVLILIGSSVLLTCSVICCWVSLSRTSKSQKALKQNSDFKVDTWLASLRNNSRMILCFPKNEYRISEEESSCRWSQRSNQKTKSNMVFQCSSGNSSMSVA